ncbi:MAG: polysaccharide biosynthesis tyrosine autokinase [Actinobacteria bacterium]|nr:MAG: polysaccharide biosynthesis tyrosine autokinase [Actinomycetota bacterium]
MEFNDVLRAIWRRRLLVVIFVAVTTLFAVLFALSRAPKYESVSTLALTPSSEGGFITPEQLDAVLGTYARTAKSSLIKNKAEDKLGEPLPGSVETGTSPGTGIMQIIGTAESGDDAAIVAKTVSTAFIRYLSNNKFVQPEIVDPATAPDSPVQPRPPLIIAIGIILGLLGGILLAYFVEQLRGRIESASDVGEVTSVPLIGALPTDRRLSRGPRLIWQEQGSAPLQEAIRALRTNLEFQLDDRQGIIQVTSPLAGEGKSVLVANLGVALSQLGIETLIVDADLRRPRQHQIFDVANETGLSNALHGKVDSKLRRVKTEFPRLSIVPGGPIAANSTEMLHVRAASLFETLRKADAMVLIDTPPVLPVSDARIVARHADGVLLTVATGKEKPSTLRSAVETLQLAGASISGIVLNFADDSLGGSEGYQPESAPRRRAQKQVATK